MPAPAKVSKNAREGRRTPPRKRYCAAGHELERVLVVKVFGRRGLRWRCECGVA